MAHFGRAQRQALKRANQSEALLCALDYLLHSGFRSSHDCCGGSGFLDSGIS